jgi:hypothetical protein
MSQFADGLSHMPLLVPGICQVSPKYVKEQRTSFVLCTYVIAQCILVDSEIVLTRVDFPRAKLQKITYDRMLLYVTRDARLKFWCLVVVLHQQLFLRVIA